MNYEILKQNFHQFLIENKIDMSKLSLDQEKIIFDTLYSSIKTN